jgi:hypothetical protein
MCNSFRRLVASFLFIAAAGAHAQANDNWSNATAIPSLPFAASEPNMYLATVEAGDPVVPCLPVVFPPVSANYTLWYKYTPALATEYITLTIPYHSPISAFISVYTGNPTDGFRIVSGGCGSESDAESITRIAGLRLSGGTTYSIEVGSSFGSLSSNDSLSFSVTSSAVYAVSKTTDTKDGACIVDNCSLRDAIDASNLIPGAVLIPAGSYKLTLADADEFQNEYLNATGSLDALHGMGIYGASMQATIIDANNLGRALDLDPVSSPSTHTSFAIGDLAIINGHAVPTSTHSVGGGGLLLNSNSDYFGLERVWVTSNQSDSPGGGGLTTNSPGTIRDSIISNNVATNYGGGGFSAGTSDGRYIEISGSTFSGNSVTDPAGGHGGGIDAFATLRISNSTISGNHAIGTGGGIYVYGSGSSLHMASSTVVLNTAQTNPVHSGSGGGGLSLDTDMTDPNSIVDSVLAYNTTANSTDPQDCLITDTSSLTSSYNHVTTTAGTADFGIAPCQFTGLGDVTGTDPGVSRVLGNNGGVTPTHALLSNSPAQDSGDPGGCRDAAGVPLDYDQRGVGFPRIGNGRCDKGAFEFIDEIFGNGFN